MKKSLLSKLLTSQNQTHRQISLPSWLTALTVFSSRWWSLPANFSPLGSFGFFSRQWWLFALNIVVFDWLKSGFYAGFIFTYLGWAGYFLIGKFAHTNRHRLALLPVASTVFYLLSNFGVWLYWYPRTMTGLITCYLVAWPFYQRTLISDLFFGGLVLAFRWLKTTSQLNQQKLVASDSN